MPAITFDLLEYMSGLTSFVFDKAVLTRIAFDRGVAEVTSYSELSESDKELIHADMLLTAYLSPDIWASYSQAHGSFKKSVGSQSVYTENKELLKKYLIGVYKKYNDPKLNELSEINEDSKMRFLDI